MAKTSLTPFAACRWERQLHVANAESARQERASSPARAVGQQATREQATVTVSGWLQRVARSETRRVGGAIRMMRMQKAHEPRTDRASMQSIVLRGAVGRCGGAAARAQLRKQATGRSATVCSMTRTRESRCWCAPRDRNGQSFAGRWGGERQRKQATRAVSDCMQRVARRGETSLVRQRDNWSQQELPQHGTRHDGPVRSGLGVGTRQCAGERDKVAALEVRA